MASMNIVYKYFDQTQLYINLTNRCTNKCKFCIRYTDTGVGGTDLWLEHEPEFDEIKEALLNNNFKFIFLHKKYPYLIKIRISYFINK